MSSTSSLKRNMDKNKTKKIQVLSALLEGRSEEQLQQESSQTREKKRTCRHGPRLVVRARASMPDAFPSALKNVNCIPSTSGAKVKVGKSKKTLGLEESSDADFTDSEFLSIESESDSETVLESYH